MQWMNGNLPDNSIVLAEPNTGNLIPGFSGKKVYGAHWAETVNVGEKANAARLFFKNDKNDNQKESWLKNNNITHIYFSEAEKKLGNFDPQNKKYLEKIYDYKQIAIYKVLENNPK